MAATSGTMLGVYNGVSLAAAMANSPLDILQITSNNGGKVVAKVASTGTVSLNPTTSTNGTVLGSFETIGPLDTLAHIFAGAFANGGALDIFQCYSEISAPASAGSGGMVLIGRLNSAGVYSTS